MTQKYLDIADFFQFLLEYWWHVFSRKSQSHISHQRCRQHEVLNQSYRHLGLFKLIRFIFTLIQVSLAAWSLTTFWFSARFLSACSLLYGFQRHRLGSIIVQSKFNPIFLLRTISFPRLLLSGSLVSWFYRTGLLKTTNKVGRPWIAPGVLTDDFI